MLANGCEDSTKRTFASHVRPSRVHGIWLDRLPSDICVRIVSFLPPHGSHNETESSLAPRRIPDSIVLAETSNKQRFSVCVAHKYKLEVPCMYDTERQKELCARWANILGDEVRKVLLPINIGVLSDVTKLLSLPNLIYACIPSSETYINAMVAGSAIRELSLDLTHRSAHPHVNASHMLPNLLDACPVKKLRLGCHLCSSEVSEPCEAIEILRLVEEDSLSFQTLESLHLKCDKAHAKYLHYVFRQFKNIQELTLERQYLEVKRRPYVDAEQAFWIWGPDFEKVAKNLRSVRILHVRGAFELSMRLGSSVTCLAINRVFSAEEVAQFHQLRNLTELDIWLEKGAEAYFPPDVCSLTSLNLRWYLDDDQVVIANDDEEDESESESYGPDVAICYRTEWWSTDYHPIVSPLFLAFLKRNMMLETLRLKHVRISRLVQEELFRTLGKRLRVLEMPLHKQGFPAIGQLCWLMRVIGNHNRGLLQFHCTEYTEDLQMCKCQEKRLKRDLEMGMEVLLRRVPRLRGVDLVVEGLLQRRPLPFDESRPRCPLCSGHGRDQDDIQSSDRGNG